MPKNDKPRHKSFEFTINNDNIKFIIEKVFEGNPKMVKKLKAILHGKSDKPPLGF